MLKSNVVNFPGCNVSALVTKKVTSHRLFRIIQESFINTMNIINQSRKGTK